MSGREEEKKQEEKTPSTPSSIRSRRGAPVAYDSPTSRSVSIMGIEEQIQEASSGLDVARSFAQDVSTPSRALGEPIPFSLPRRESRRSGPTRHEALMQAFAASLNALPANENITVRARGRGMLYTVAANTRVDLPSTYRVTWQTMEIIENIFLPELKLLFESERQENSGSVSLSDKQYAIYLKQFADCLPGLNLSLVTFMRTREPPENTARNISHVRNRLLRPRDTLRIPATLPGETTNQGGTLLQTQMIYLWHYRSAYLYSLRNLPTLTEEANPELYVTPLVTLAQLRVCQEYESLVTNFQYLAQATENLRQALYDTIDTTMPLLSGLPESASHNPPINRLLALASSLGQYVVGEVPFSRWLVSPLSPNVHRFASDEASGQDDRQARKQITSSIHSTAQLIQDVCHTMRDAYKLMHEQQLTLDMAMRIVETTMTKWNTGINGTSFRDVMLSLIDMYDTINDRIDALRAKHVHEEDVSDAGEPGLEMEHASNHQIVVDSFFTTAEQEQLWPLFGLRHLLLHAINRVRQIAFFAHQIYRKLAALSRASDESADALYKAIPVRERFRPTFDALVDLNSAAGILPAPNDDTPPLRGYHLFLDTIWEEEKVAPAQLYSGRRIDTLLNVPGTPSRVPASASASASASVPVAEPETKGEFALEDAAPPGALSQAEDFKLLGRFTLEAEQEDEKQPSPERGGKRSNTDKPGSGNKKQKE